MSKINNNLISSRIKALMGDESQTSFADRIKISQSSVSKMISGETPSVSTLLAIAHAYDVSTDWLLGLSDDQKRTTVPSSENMTYADALCVLDKLLQTGSISAQHPDQPRTLYVRDEVLFYLLKSRAKAEGLDIKTREFWYKQIAEQFVDTEILDWQDRSRSHFEKYVPKNPNNEDIIDFIQSETNGNYDNRDFLNIEF